MQPYSEPIGGSFRETWHDEIYGTGDGNRVTFVQAGLRDLSNVVSQSGNSKNANPQSYVKVLDGPNTQVYTASRTLDDNRTYSYSKSGDFPTSGGFGLHSDPDTYNKVVSNLGEAIRGSVDLSIDGFQGRQTLELARHILSVRKVVEFLARKTIKDNAAIMRRNSALIRKRVNAAKLSPKDKHKGFPPKYELQPLRDIGSYWLEYRYGLVPTLQTIHDLVSGAALRAGNQMRIDVKAKNVVVTNVRDSYEVQFVDDTYSTTFRYRIGGYYTPSSSHVESLSRLSSLNPVSIAWELMPFSFVVDWFYDVGGYLRSIETAMVSNLGQFDGYITFTKREVIRQQTTINGLVGGDTVHSVVRQNRMRTEKTRSPLSSVPYPRPPSFRAELGSGRLLNAAALLSQFLKR